MKSKSYTITQVTPLVNGFNEVTIHAPVIAPLALPGHYVILEEQYSCYLLGHQADTISLIIMDPAGMIAANSKIHLSPLLGVPFDTPTQDTFYLIQTNEDGLNALIFYLKKYRRSFYGLTLIEAKQFPFKPCPSRILIHGMPPEVIAALPLFEDWQIPHRLASTIAQPGCFYGSNHLLAERWLKTVDLAKPIKKFYIVPSCEIQS